MSGEEMKCSAGWHPAADWQSAWLGVFNATGRRINNPPQVTNLHYIALLTLLFTATAFSATFSGESAFEYTRHAVEFGPRPAGSPANAKLQAYIIAELKKRTPLVTEDAFTAQTPRGPVAMKNILARFPGKSGKTIVVTGHFDTKPFEGRKFVGANDGGSSTGLLLELARVLEGAPRVDDVVLVFFDGEEAFGEWSDTDSVYGSRHLAERWKKDGTAAKVKALINVDMIGDKNLNVQPDLNSSGLLRTIVWNTAMDLGYEAFFPFDPITIDDDHMPFVRIGVPSIDIIDFDYPAWHRDEDTMDKLSAKSLEIVGRVVAESIVRLEK
jgi:Zn-dependent M28 family amino/carboxypeptidase